MTLKPIPVFEIVPNVTKLSASYHSVQNRLSSILLSKNLNITIYRNIILPVVLYGCDTWSLTLREERRLRVFENRVLRRIFEPKRYEIKREWRKLHNEELNDLYCADDKIEKNEMGGACSTYGGRGVCRVLVDKPEGKRPLGRPRRRWEDNIKIDFQEVGCRAMDWIALAQVRDRRRALVNAVMDRRVP